MPYVAPVKDMLFVMNELAGLSDVVAYPSYAEAGADVDLAPAILEESAKFNQDVVAPLNWAGDQNPSSLKDGVVTTTPGFKNAFEQYAAAGWQGVIHPAIKLWHLWVRWIAEFLKNHCHTQDHRPRDGQPREVCWVFQLMPNPYGRGGLAQSQR